MAGETVQAHSDRPEARAPSVEALNLSRSWGSHQVLCNIRLTVEAGENFALLGANGAGKTTFIRLLTGYLLPSSGEVRIDGISPNTHPKQVQARIGYVPEVPRLYPELRVRRFLEFVAGLHGLSGRKKSKAVDSVLNDFRLEEVAKRSIGHLSKGYRQRVSLAQAFLHGPSLLIADEPTAGLDPYQREDVHELLLGLKDRCTILLSTHDLAEARALTSRAAILDHGQIVATGESQRLLDSADLSVFRGKLQPEEQA